MTTTLTTHTLHSSFLSMTTSANRSNGISTSVDLLPRAPQSPRHFFEKLYGHLETNSISNLTPSRSAKQEAVDSVVLSRSLLTGRHEHGTPALDLVGLDSGAISRPPFVHSPPQHSNLSGSSADISDTR